MRTDRGHRTVTVEPVRDAEVLEGELDDPSLAFSWPADRLWPLTAAELEEGSP